MFSMVVILELLYQDFMQLVVQPWQVLHGKEQLLELQISSFAKPYHENPFC
jgi:hypothetical protein